MNIAKKKGKYLKYFMFSGFEIMYSKNKLKTSNGMQIYLLFYSNGFEQFHDTKYYLSFWSCFVILLMIFCAFATIPENGLSVSNLAISSNSIFRSGS